MTNDDHNTNHSESGTKIESRTGSFLIIQLPPLDGLKQIHGYSLDFAVQRAIKKVTSDNLGDHTQVWLDDRIAVQLHTERAQSELRSSVTSFAKELDRGLTISLDGTNTQIQWVNRPRIGVLENPSKLDLAQRIACSDEAVRSVQDLGFQIRAPLNVAYYQEAITSSEREGTDWRKEKALRLALQNQELELQFSPVCAAATNGLAGFRSQFRTLIKYDKSRIQISHPEIMEISERIGFKGESNQLLLKSALNQCRIWQLLVPGNDASITIPVNTDAIIENQSSIFELLKIYSDVASRIVIALEVHEGSVTASELPALNATVSELHRLTGVRFALTDFGMSKLNLSMAQEVDVQVIYLAGQWPDTATSHTFNDPILPNLIELLHSLRTEVVATNVASDTQLQNLKKARIDWYEPSTRNEQALREDQALDLIENHQKTIANTVINAQFRFRHAN